MEATLMKEVFQYDKRHGGPYDRGSADAYYHRSYAPHYFKGASYSSPLVPMQHMTADEIVAYTKGYNETTDRKDWGGE
jgi:hypothetical protein